MDSIVRSAVMGALFLPSSSITMNKLMVFPDNNKHNAGCFRMKRCVVSCQGGGGAGNAIKSSGVLSFLKELSALLSSDHPAATLMDAESFVFSQKDKRQTDIEVKDLVPYGGQPSTTLMGLQDGIGIVKFLRGKSFSLLAQQVLIEKILRIEPDVGKIYLLIKSKNKEAAMERLKSEIISAELFNCLRLTLGKSFEAFMLSKLIPVVGNVCKSNLGLEESLTDLIAGEVDIIVNSAANTTFDERYDVAIDINTRGPCHLLDLAKKCKKLKLFLQVSTDFWHSAAYVNGQRQGRIMEQPFVIGDNIATGSFTSELPTRSLPTLDIEHEIKLASSFTKNFKNNGVYPSQGIQNSGIERARRYGWQDTYVFTKAMGEMMIDKLRGEIPVVIIRPSVIESTFKEPFPGWMEGNRMMDPIVMCYGKGQLTSFLVDPNGVLDVVPADMVVNATLAAIAKHGMDQKPDVNVYQIASSAVNPLVFQELARLLYEHYSSSPCIDSKGRPIEVPLMKLFSSAEEFSAHLWKDAIGRIGVTDIAPANEKTSQRLDVIRRKSVEQAKHLANIYEPYTFYGGRFDNSNTEELMESMSEEEKKKFGFDVRSIDWQHYIKDVHIPGLRRHVMKGRGMPS